MPRTRTILTLAALPLFACGPSSPGPQSPIGQTSGPPVSVTPRDLGGLPPADCSTKSFLDQLGGTCTARATKGVSGSGTAANIGIVSDGDACSAWSSGGMPPQSLDIDLGEPEDLTTLLLIPDLTPPQGDVEHDIVLADEHGNPLQHLDVSAGMTSGHGYAVQLPNPIRPRFLRITTTRGPGWVAWREIVPLGCAAPAPPH